MLTEILNEITREVARRHSHRATPLVFAGLFALTLSLGGDPSELAPRVSALLFCTSVAYGALSLGAKRRAPRLALSLAWALLLWAVCAGPAIGTVELPFGGESDHYWVGSEKRAAVHFGQPLRLSREGEEIKLNAGLPELGLQRASLGQEAEGRGARVELAGHQLQLIGLQETEVPRAATLRIRPRSEPSAEGTLIQLSVDERAPLPGGGGSVTLNRLSLNRGSKELPHLGAGAEVTLRWRSGEGATQSSEEQRSWLYLRAPTLDEQAGLSPWVLTLEEIQRGEAATLLIRRGAPRRGLFELMLLIAALLWTWWVERRSPSQLTTV
ncbi:MAG: hypothetical protein VYD19_06485 [Myxococcota bacterium]|nr:hypothetical protein [Myxococcota bacterium]